MSIDAADATNPQRRRRKRNTEYDALGKEFLMAIPGVCQVVYPDALDIKLELSPSTYKKPIRIKSFLEPRHITIRCTCTESTHSHMFFFGLSTVNEEDAMTTEGASNIASLLNSPKIIECLTDSKGVCSNPFCHATVIDGTGEKRQRTLEGIGYHCHCVEPFSLDCWDSAFFAAEKTASVCRHLRRAKSYVDED